MIRFMRGSRHALLLAAAAVVAAALVGTAASEDDDLGMLGNKRTVALSAVKQKGKGANGAEECTATSGGANTKLDCDDPFPNNEPQVEVDPANPLHIVASSNDYGSCCDEYYTTFDGGRTWRTGNVSSEKVRDGLGPIGSDPVTAFDRRHGTTMHASLNFFLTKAGDETCNGDIVVSPSRDGGITWLQPVVVAEGHGCDLSGEQVFNDKEWIETDNNRRSPFYGRTYLVWTRYLARLGETLEAPIWESHSDDGGFKWSEPREISGSNAALCTFQTAGKTGRCDEDGSAIPTISPDGTVYVAFQNEQNEALWEAPQEFDSQYLLVKSTDGGETWSAPTFVAGLEDGEDDYPINVEDRQTLTGYQARVNSAGNIVAAPNGTLYVVFSDNRNGQHDVGDPVTNTDVFVTSSTNGGRLWSAPVRVDTGAGDQWFPWVDVNPASGKIGVLYHDRGALNGATYTTALAEGQPGSFVRTTLPTVASNPVESLFFQAEAGDCPECAVFFGDYISVAYGSDGHANAAWTDMRDFVPDDDGFAQFIYFARN
jgi:hypothetical protein